MGRGPVDITVAAVIPTYNYAHGIHRAIESILAQTHPADDIIVVDDGSTDATREAVLRYAPAVRYLYQANAGAAAARNRGVRETSCKWVAFLDHDDEWLPQKLERQLLAIGDGTRAAINYSGYYVRRDGQADLVATVPPPDTLFPGIRLANRIGPTATYMVNREMFLQCGGFSVSLGTSCEDWDLLIRLAVAGTVTYCPEALTRYHDHAKCESRNWHKMFVNELKIVDTSLLAGLSGWKRAITRRQVLAAIYARAAFGAAQGGDPSAALLRKSLFLWPLPGIYGKRVRCLLNGALRR